MLFLAANGFRSIAHDRRGHGRSTQTWDGNDMDTYADDLATLIDTLDLTRRRAGRVLHRRRRGGPVRRPARHRPGGQDRAGLRGAAVHAADPGQSRRGADRGVRRIRAARSPTVRRPTRTWPTGRSSAATGPAPTRPAGSATRSGCRACRPATATPWSASRRSPPPTSDRTWTRSTSPPWSSTVTTTRSCRSRSAARPRRRGSRAPSSRSIPAPRTASPTPTGRLCADLLAFLNPDATTGAPA